MLICQKLIDHFGRDRHVDDLRPDDFGQFRSNLSKTLGPVALGNQITRCRSVFKFALDQRLIDHPVIYGQSFDRPSAKMLRRARNEAGQMMLEADELRRILDADPPMTRAGGRPACANRDCFEGIVFVLLSGCRWKGLPSCFPYKSVCHQRFRTWTEQGLFERAWQRLLDLKKRLKQFDASTLVGDGTFVPAKKGVAA